MPFYTTRESIPQTWLLDWVSGRYYPPPFQGTLTTAATSATAMFCNAHYVPNVGGVTAIRVGLEITTAAGAGNTSRLGFYKDYNGRPEELLLDAGTVAIDSTGWKEATVSQSLPQGWIWVACISSATATVRAFLSGTHINIYSQIDELASANSPLTYRVETGNAVQRALWNATGLPEIIPGLAIGSPVHTTGIPRTMIGV